MDFWEIMWFLIAGLVLVAYLVLLVEIVRDLLRDPALSGWKRAAWLIALIWLPILTSIVYIVARGGGTASRLHEHDFGRDAQARQAQYARSVSGLSPSQEIAQAKSMWDTGVIDRGEFDALKLKALS